MEILADIAEELRNIIKNKNSFELSLGIYELF